MSKINLIVAYAKENRAIGKENSLLWNLPNDLKNFKKLTDGQIVVMGRKTYESIPEKFRPLPNRLNIVLSRNFEIVNDVNVVTKKDIQEILDFCEHDIREVFVIGGGSVYKQFLDSNLVDELHLSLVEGDYHDADTFFPEINFENWEIVEVVRHDGFEYQRWVKKSY